MANRVYLVGGSQHLWAGDLAWNSDNLKMVACTSTYTPNTAAGGDEFLTAIPGGAIPTNGTSPNLTSKSSVAGVLKAANPLFTSVTGGTITQFVLYNDTGSSATSELILIYDTASGGLPCVPNGGNITFQFAGAPNFVAATSFAGLTEREKKKMWGFWERLRGALGDISIDRTPSGIWIGTPTIIQEMPCSTK